MIFNTTGGGASLNFDVKAYATEAALLAATPKENTIGIITTTPITSWVFSATEPASPANGMVWITTGTSSTVEFNALKKNAIQVYPLSAKQYVGGKLVDVTAMSYQGGKWTDWVYYIFKSGVGKKVELTAFKESSTSIVTIGTDNIVLSWSDEEWCSGVRTAKKIDLTNYSTLNMKYTCSETGTSDYASAFGVSSSVFSSGDTTTEALNVARKSVSRATSVRTDTLDISNLSGNYYVGAYGGGKVTIYDFWMK